MARTTLPGIGSCPAGASVTRRSTGMFSRWSKRAISMTLLAPCECPIRGVKRARRLLLMPEAEHCVEQEHSHDNDEIDKVFDQYRHDRGGLDHPRHRSPKELAEHLERADLLFRQCVWPVLLQPLLRLSIGQAGFRIDAELLQRLRSLQMLIIDFAGRLALDLKFRPLRLYHDDLPFA